eukprot:gene10671-13070_t
MFAEQVLRKVSTAQQHELFKKDSELLEDIYRDINDFDVTPILEQLKDSLFLLVVVGEFNSGKSSFLNALLGNQFLKEGITPTTSKINILKYGESPTFTSVEDKEVIQLPVVWLKDISLVDTPGTNAVIKGHQEITEHFIPRSDLILFVTSVDRAFSESERIFLQQIRQWGKKIVVVLSKADLVELNPLAADPKSEMAEVMKFVSDNFEQQLGMTPVIFPVSSKLALKGKLTVAKEDRSNTLQQFNENLSRNQSWQSSKFADLEKYILHTLDSNQRAKLKLLNPLGVAENILKTLSDEMNSRSKVLSIDINTVKQVNDQLERFQSEMKSDFDYHLNRIENILLKMENRADIFLDDNIKISNIFQLMRSEEVKHKFEREVIGAISHEIEIQVSTLIDWIVDKNMKQWKSIVNYLDQRSSSRLEKVIGVVNRNADFLHNRQQLLDGVGEGTHKALSEYNKENQANKVGQDIKKAVFHTAALEIGAVGIASIVATSLLDLSGFIGVGVLAFAGLSILPARKRVLKKQVHAKISDLRSQLTGLIKTHIENELETGIIKIRDGISPYSSYINFEVSKINNYQNKVQKYNHRIIELKNEIDKL